MICARIDSPNIKYEVIAVIRTEADIKSMLIRELIITYALKIK
jgi:hypothetical protein